MLGTLFIVVAIILRLAAGADYLIATIKGRVKPNPVTWLFWGLAPMIAFAAQAQSGLEPSSWVTFILGLGPLLIFAIAVTKNKKQRWKLSLSDMLCGASAALGLILWQITSDPMLALTFGIVADILGGLPTLYKSYHFPESEKALPYFLSLVSMVITMFALTHWDYINAGFPVYIFCINSVLFILIWTRIGVRIKARKA
jgi:hypothetical protein